MSGPGSGMGFWVYAFYLFSFGAGASGVLWPAQRGEKKVPRGNCTFDLGLKPREAIHSASGARGKNGDFTFFKEEISVFFGLKKPHARADPPRHEPGSLHHFSVECDGRLVIKVKHRHDVAYTPEVPASVASVWDNVWYLRFIELASFFWRLLPVAPRICWF